MNRAVVGVGLVAGALLLILMLAAVRGRMVPGQASAQPSTPPPRAGDCVTQDPKDRGADLYTWTTVLPTVATGSCTGDRFGEVTAVLPAETARAVIAGAAAQPCQASVDEFLGMQGVLPSDNGGFYRFDAVPVAVVGPTISNVRSARTGRRAWCTCRCPGTRRYRCGLTTRSAEPGNTRWTAGCSPSVGSRRCRSCSGTALLRTPSRCSAPRAYQPASGSEGGGGD